MLLAVVAGAAFPIQASINGEFAQRGATIFWSVAISAALTAATTGLVAAFVLRIPPPSIEFFTRIPPWLWWGGFLGVLVLGIMSFLPQRIGAATMIACFIAGQALCALLLDYLGA